MAIDHIPHPQRHDLARTAKRFYPVKIPVSHWQLRHYISTPAEDLLYYASGQDIFCLNTAGRKRKHIARLPFEARCTASGHGWICVGGEDEGHFAAIKLDGTGARSLDVDAALPLDHWRQNSGRRAASVKYERIGEEIVNSISIHRIQDEDAHLDDIIAVLTNNDRTVRIYSLPLGQETKVKDLPFAMNHATISPDGQTLVAVGDVNQAYFFKRELLDSPPQIPKPHNRLNSSNVEWKLMTIVNLHVSSAPQATKGYFTTAWSPNGRLVAVGSEGGYITVFDIEVLSNPDVEDDAAVVALVPGSRADDPSPHPGAIRSMMFSPDPWDLLIWAEDQERICIGDLRTDLKDRQIINLEPKDEGLTRLLFEDVPNDISNSLAHLDDLENEWLQRQRHGWDTTSPVDFAMGYIEARRRQRQHQREDLMNLRSQNNSPRLGDGHDGLSEEEQAILETLRPSRQREEARTHGDTPRSVNYSSHDLFTIPNERSSPSAATDWADAARPISEILSSVPDSFPELSRTTHAASPRPSSAYGADSANALPPMHALPDSIWSRPNYALPRVGDSSRLPRRRQSVVLNLPHVLNTTSRTQGSAADAEASEDENPWRTVEDAMSASAGRGPLFESNLRTQGATSSAANEPPSESEVPPGRRQVWSNVQSRTRELWTARALRTYAAQASSSSSGPGETERRYNIAEARRMAALPVDYDLMAARRGTLRGYSGRENGVRTAGLAISRDGRTLWAACEEGIFEVDIMVKQRMFWPARDVR